MGEFKVRGSTTWQHSFMNNLKTTLVFCERNNFIPLTRIPKTSSGLPVFSSANVYALVGQIYPREHIGMLWLLAYWTYCKMYKNIFIQKTGSKNYNIETRHNLHKKSYFCQTILKKNNLQQVQMTAAGNQSIENYSHWLCTSMSRTMKSLYWCGTYSGDLSHLGAVVQAMLLWPAVTEGIVSIGNNRDLKWQLMLALRNNDIKSLLYIDYFWDDLWPVMK